MKKSILTVLYEANAKCVGDATLISLGKEGMNLAMAPVEKALPKELVPLSQTPLVRVGFASALLLAADCLGVEGSDSVVRALFAGAWDNFVGSIGPDHVKKIEDRVIEVIGTPVHQPSTPTVVANTSKGSSNIVDKAKGVLSNVFAGPAGGPIDPRFAAKQNTAEGGQHEVQIEVVYHPMSKDELKKDDKNLCICPNPLNKEPHSKQRDKFQPWSAPNGYREDLKGMYICGGCRDFLTAEYNREKKAKQAEEEATKKLSEAQGKLDDANAQYADLADKFTKAEATRATFAKLVADDPTNTDTTEALANQEKKVRALAAEKKKLEDLMFELELLLDPKASSKVEDTVKTAPVNVIKPTAADEIAANTSAGNVKLSTSAAARHQQHQQKKGKK
jgi:hypothetical protein